MNKAGRVLVGAVFVTGGCALFSACGSTASSTSDDGGADGAGLKETSTLDTSVADTSASADSATCDLAVDLTTEIPDAALDEAGTKSTGLCLACANTAKTCKTQIDSCNANCDCKSIAGNVLTCIAKGGSQIACAAMAAGVSSEAQTIGYALLGCVQKYCSAECSPQALSDGGGDAADGS